MSVVIMSHPHCQLYATRFGASYQVTIVMMKSAQIGDDCNDARDHVRVCVCVWQ